MRLQIPCISLLNPYEADTRVQNAPSQIEVMCQPQLNYWDTHCKTSPPQQQLKRCICNSTISIIMIDSVRAITFNSLIDINVFFCFTVVELTTQQLNSQSANSWNTGVEKHRLKLPQFLIWNLLIGSSTNNCFFEKQSKHY